MKRLPEAVTTKFTELFAALHSATDDLKMTSAEACLIDDFSQVAVINNSCRKLQTLESEIKAFLNNFDAKYNARSEEKAGFHKKIRNRSRKTRGHLRVTVADRFIEEPTIAKTFLETLKAFGLKWMAKFNKTVSLIPLVARTPVNSHIPPITSKCYC